VRSSFPAWPHNTAQIRPDGLPGADSTRGTVHSVKVFYIWLISGVLIKLTGPIVFGLGVCYWPPIPFAGIMQQFSGQSFPHGEVWQKCHTFQNNERGANLMVDFFALNMENSRCVIWFYTPSS